MTLRVLATCLAVAAFVVADEEQKAVDVATEQSKTMDTPAPSIMQLPMPTMGGTQFWADELLFREWRIQRNVLTGHCRLLDGNYFRHASGSYEHCRAKLDEIKQNRKLPPMHGNAVVVLHGLGRTRNAMLILAIYLDRVGGYTVFNVGYPSTRGSIAHHARSLAKIIDNLDGIDQINFVGHSLGNIVIRRYLADQTDEAAGRRPDPRIKRFVMLGPPNHGSKAATSLADNRLFTSLLGKPGQELGREWVWLESDLATPQCEFGIVAGGMGNDRGFSPMLPGDDDGVVTLETTRLAGASDFVVVPVTHTLLPDDPRVLKYTLSFLQNGYFISPDQRQAVTEE